ncbi:MAG: outer membrane lipoprotein carrier protein LolA [Bacteroidota bacterium]
MLRYRFLILALTLCLTQIISANPIDPGRDILNKSRRQISLLQDISSSFTYVIQHPNRNPVNRSGSFIYKQGKYVIDLPSQRLICDQARLWVYAKRENTVSVQTYDPSSDVGVQRIFEVYQTNVQAVHTGSEVIGGIACEKLVLDPTDRDKSFTKAFLWVDKRNALPVRIVMINRNGTTTNYTFSNMQVNRGVSDRVFGFDFRDYPGVTSGS